ncbi:adenylate/guanylate cyclase domain-containing protein [Reyranella soli]|uniref:Adenylate cyclase n=1 Tax=Reyranella soli TaxID=1230389 RepID=A0A512NPX3_9HYPH|nr:adenylate/guanylate cyclase domain-containing protein [Reyranella soli]GEP60972.1 adenylate cyclase [Reyranella soli]
MDTRATASTVLGGTISAWLAEQALLDSEPAALYAALCQRLRAVGFPILRGQVGFRILHPLYDASAISWTADKGTVVSLFRPDDVTGQERFDRSPFGHALAHRLPVLRRRLTGETALFDFTELEEFRAVGGTDYVVFLVAFESAARTGVICSWLADRALGFTDDEIVQLQRITRELGIAMKSRIERSVAHNVAHAYLGKRAGDAVLNGSIRRGDGEKITAALWYSDLRQSTTLADRLSADDFLNLLGRYFEMTASAVLDAGGEVVSLIGDAVLGLFRVEAQPEEACRRALAAAHEARRRLGATDPSTNLPLDFGIALHLGQVIHGNVGVPERLQFTVVGSAVNEVVRVQDLTKQLACPVLATAPFAAAVAGPWRPVGEHVLRGLDTPMPILAVAAS